ncbi:hypothetical protein QN357_01580 [Cryobacterium sp. RTC2.1]|uniref:hypothetical protein n=1 Tax=Cryobacterium sp. RTC2.1 TaxID=3048634 RepID=UPI002B233439|nr:hypothetical protein [Cryobacterium sp. RTC2.1]MEB0001627.1 hypothetical protein [Cryobacterium sp. RTC2.1]
MTTTAELTRTFEDLAISQRKNADSIEVLAATQGLPSEVLAGVVTQLREQAAVCDSCAQALRDGDATSIDDIMSGGIEGPFIGNDGRVL